MDTQPIHAALARVEANLKLAEKSCKDLRRIDDKARELGLTLIPRKAAQRDTAKRIFRRTGGYNNFLKLGLEEWPAND
jgi:hypothetical protein